MANSEKTKETEISILPWILASDFFQEEHDFFLELSFYSFANKEIINIYS